LENVKSQEENHIKFLFTLSDDTIEKMQKPKNALQYAYLFFIYSMK
jgi:hypothetical protein